MTDQKAHNLGVPQFGPGKELDVPLDYGHIVESGNPEDLFAFRTPPLRNVTLTGPWMHNGAYDNLEDVIRHHLDPEASLLNYDLNQLPESLHPMFQDDEQVLKQISKTIDPKLKNLHASEAEIQDLLAFLQALTDDSAEMGVTEAPKRVPSGLPVDD